MVMGAFEEPMSEVGEMFDWLIEVKLIPFLSHCVVHRTCQRIGGE